jgi:hypothetical protein
MAKQIKIQGEFPKKESVEIQIKETATVVKDERTVTVGAIEKRIKDIADLVSTLEAEKDDWQKILDDYATEINNAIK